MPPPNGGELCALRDAGNYIAKLPKREQDSFAWPTVIQALLLVAEQVATPCCRGLASCRYAALYPQRDGADAAQAFLS
jgi:hypothetical protein